MGEVYKAHDTRLDRVVAIKVLPDTLAADPQFRDRFQREARTISQLDHPHICALYDVGEQNGTSFLVMQYLEGETLAQRLHKGALPIGEALTLGIQIAGALDTAHRAGIVHRDLKPGNVMVTKTGAKLLDFGLAKLRTAAAPLSMSGLTQVATTAPATAKETILGTVHYMAPEQLEGKDADARSDIWALGAVLYEMVTGQRPFDGHSPATIVGAILKDDPPPVSTRQPLVPEALDHVIETALAKDPEDRWQSAADVARELHWVSRASTGALTARPARSWRKYVPAVGWLVAAVFALALLLRPAVRVDAPVRQPIRFEIPPPQNATSASLAEVAAVWPVISPDGTRIVFVAAQPGASRQLWLRRLDSLEATAVPGTDDAAFPFWSPDGQRVGFFTPDKLKTIDLAGGTPQVLTDVRGLQGRGATWNQDGRSSSQERTHRCFESVTMGVAASYSRSSVRVRRRIDGHRFSLTAGTFCTPFALDRIRASTSAHSMPRDRSGSWTICRMRHSIRLGICSSYARARSWRSRSIWSGSSSPGRRCPFCRGSHSAQVT